MGKDLSSASGLSAAKHGADNESITAVKAVVDDNMRTDVLGPNFCRVLSEHIPTAKALNGLIASAIRLDPEVKSAISAVLEELDQKRKSKWVDRVVGAISGICIAVVIAVLTLIAQKLVAPSSNSQGNNQERQAPPSSTP